MKYYLDYIAYHYNFSTDSSKIHNNMIIARNSTSIPECANKDYDLMDGHEFEYFCASLLEQNGFTNIVVTQDSVDDGIDILAEKKKLNTAYSASAIQAILVTVLYNKPIPVFKCINVMSVWS